MTLVLRSAAVLALLPGAALAEEPSTLMEPGARVRLTLPCSDGTRPASERPGSTCRIEGRMDHLDPDAITLTGTPSSPRHPLATVMRIEVSRGSRSHWLAGAGAGFVAAAVGTYVAINRGDSTNPCDSSANQDAIGQAGCLGIAAAGGVAGAGLGALVGSLFRSERWEDLPREKWRVSLGPRPGARLHVSVAFAF